MYIDNNTDLEDYYTNFYHWVMECVDDEDLPPDNEICSCEDLCKSCAWEKRFGEGECPCFMGIDRIGYDDKGNNIVASCHYYEK